MGVTYTTAVERDTARDRRRFRGLQGLDLALAAASLLAIAMLAAAYQGRFRRRHRRSNPRST
jgi:hypothetical protein